jgi:heme oxygenase
MKTLFWMESISQQDLRSSCADLHDQAEHTRLAQDLLNASIDPLIYKNYCYQLYLIADAIETKMQFPSDLNRRHLLVQDIANGPACSVTACPSTLEYARYLNTHYLPHLHGQLNGHIYTHYLGWLYGGQMIAKKLQFLPKKHLEFRDPRACVDYVRKTVLNMVWDRDAVEAKKAFEYSIKIYNELYELH